MCFLMTMRNWAKDMVTRMEKKRRDQEKTFLK